MSSLSKVFLGGLTVCVWAGVDNAWEQKKLEATLCEMLAAKRAADRASKPPASIAQNKRIGACHPTRQAVRSASKARQSARCVSRTTYT